MAYHRGSHHHWLLFLTKHLWYGLFVSVVFFSVCCLSRKKMCFFKTKVAWQWGKGQSRCPVGGIHYLGPSHAEVPCSDWSHLTSTVRERKLTLVPQFYTSQHKGFILTRHPIEIRVVPQFHNCFMHFEQPDTTDTKPTILWITILQMSGQWSDQTSLCQVKICAYGSSCLKDREMGKNTFMIQK